ncbi:hypothetical protein BGW80DRAFT_899607 [Lactifluus volemus]|nr:hypothetical protein BGW80DRAFT_899607 [Lactifluus volemus]
MAPPTTPIASSSNIKPKKLKKPSEKSRKENVVSLNAETVSAIIGISNRNEAPAASTPPVAADSSVPADYYGDAEFGEFDYDAVNANEHAELWLIRAPTAVKSSLFQGVKISPRLGQVGDIHRKSTAYDIYALEPPPPLVDDESGNNNRREGVQEGGTAAMAHVGAGVSAEELGSLSVLLPCKRKGGKHYLASKPITRHLVVAGRPPKPTNPDPSSDSTTYLNPPREAYPDEAFTHRFRPYGDPGDPPHEEHTGAELTEVSMKEKEKRKRKGGEPGSPKKKAKTNA